MKGPLARHEGGKERRVVGPAAPAQLYQLQPMELPQLRHL